MTKEKKGMVLEIATLDIKAGSENDFLSAFSKAELIISTMKGYISHTLNRCIENPGRFVLLVEWETLEDHTKGFRGSQQYEEWKGLLNHHYAVLPTVEHYENI